MITSIGPIAAAGAAAGGTLVLAQLIFENELDTVESQAVGIVAAGAALTGYACRQGPVAQQLVAAYWMIAAIAGVPAVAAYWARRKAQATHQRAVRGVAIAGGNYRGDHPSTAAPASGHR